MQIRNEELDYQSTHIDTSLTACLPSHQNLSTNVVQRNARRIPTTVQYAQKVKERKR